MIPKQKSERQLQKEVDVFNSKHPVGSKVNLLMDNKETKEVTVNHVATIMGGHSAVGWFKEVSGCYLLDKVSSS